MKRTGGDWRPRRHFHRNQSTTPERTRGKTTMTTKQYLAALKKLGLTPSGKATAAALGLTLRQCQRLAAGDQKVSATVALLLAMYLRHGLTERS